jgi:hypothetical protein
MSPTSLEKFQNEFVDPIADKLLRNDLSPKHKKRIERRLEKIPSKDNDDDKLAFEFTKRQTSILHTAMVLVKFEILSKANYWKSKPTLDVMQEIIVMLEAKLKENSK